MFFCDSFINLTTYKLYNLYNCCISYTTYIIGKFATCQLKKIGKYDPFELLGIKANSEIKDCKDSQLRDD